MRPHLFVLATLALVGAGCLSGPADIAASDAAITNTDRPWQRVHVFDGERGPADAPSAFTFDVPTGATAIEALLTWRQPGAQLGFRLLDPDGEEAARGWNEAEGRAYVTNTHPVVPGEWTLEIFSERALAAAYAATVTIRSDAPDHGPITTTFVLPPRNLARELPAELRGTASGAFARDFAEVNLNMVPGNAFDFAWTSTREVYFNVHYHGANGTTERPIEYRGASLEGNFTATKTEVYALLWRNEGTESVEIELEMDGAYRLHSMTRRA